MDVFGEPWTTRHARYFADPKAGAEALLNDASEWLQYAQTNLKVLIELVNERGAPDARRLTVVLEGVGAFIEMGARSAGQAHMRVQLELMRRNLESSSVTR